MLGATLVFVREIVGKGRHDATTGTLRSLARSYIDKSAASCIVPEVSSSVSQIRVRTLKDDSGLGFHNLSCLLVGQLEPRCQLLER